MRNFFTMKRFIGILLALVLALSVSGAFADVYAPVNPLGSNAAPLPTAAPAEAEATEEGEEASPADPVDEMDDVSDEESQDWYDQVFEMVSSVVPLPGVVENGALRAKGQVILSEEEAAVLMALEDAELGENDMIDSDGKINILLLGVDARPGQKTGRSDAMILCSVDLETNTIKMISFMRDMYVQIPDHNPNRLNTAYYWGGPDLLYRTLEKNFGVKVDHYIAVDFSVLGSLIDQLGGLEIDVGDDYFVDRINAIIENANKVLGINKNDGKLKNGGLQVLTGKQAQAYARFRYGAKSGGDFARTGRQREVLMKIFEKVTQLSVPEMANLAMNNIDAIDTDMTVVDLVKLAPVALQLKDAQFEELRVPSVGYFHNTTIKGMSVILPDYNRVNKQIREFLG